MESSTVATMIQDDFFAVGTEPDGWGSPTTELRADLLGQLRLGPVAGVDDLDVAIALTGLVWDELKAYGTDGATRLDEEQIALAQRAVKATLHRVGIELDFPWRNFESFKTHWIKNECSGSWPLAASYWRSSSARCNSSWTSLKRRSSGR